MTIYKGTILHSGLYSVLQDIFLQEGYEEVSSNHTNDGYVFKTLGKDDRNEFYIRLRSTSTYYLTVGVYEKYIPNSVIGLEGEFINGNDRGSIFWKTSASDPWTKVNYIINVNKDRAIIYVEGMPNETNSANSITYAGLPIRYDSRDINGEFAGVAYTGGFGNTDNHHTWYALKNRANQNNAAYKLRYYYPASLRGWGDQIFFSKLFVEGSGEGLRGELDSIYLTRDSDEDYEIRHGDEFTKDNKRYKFIKPTREGGDTLYNSYNYIIEI